MKFSQRLRQLMDANDHTEKSLAEATGLCHVKIHRLTHGRSVKAADLANLADHFGLSMDALYRGSSEVPGHDLLVVTHDAITATRSAA